MTDNKFPKIKIKGSGASIPPGVEKLGMTNKPGDKVWWLDKNEVEQGVLKEYEWDGDKCTAIVTKSLGSLHQHDTAILL
jgi:hypothetical protein